MQTFQRKNHLAVRVLDMTYERLPLFALTQPPGSPRRVVSLVKFEKKNLFTHLRDIKNQRDIFSTRQQLGTCSVAAKDSTMFMIRN